MKYIFAAIGASFALFLALIIYGWSLPQTFVFERSTSVSSEAENIYSKVVDVEQIRMWAPYFAGLGLDDTAITGAERGSGQVINWRAASAPFETGVQDVLAVTPPYFVQSRFSSPPYEGSIIYALSEVLPADDVTVLVRLDLDAGGAPFFNRVKLHLAEKSIHEELEQSLVRLKTIAER